MKSLISLIIILALLATVSGGAQTPPPQFPCEDEQRFAEFDYWVGQWAVHGTQGKLAGKNSIVRAEYGRVRQYFEQSNDGGETWVPWFEGFYTRTSEK